KAPGVSREDSEPWKVASALFSCPSAEIWADTCWVWLEISASCGAWVAATSCCTSELTLMTEPPAASALLLPATDTTGAGLPVVLLTLVAISDSTSLLRPHQKNVEGRVPALKHPPLRS